jgi:hypothetical protein
MSNFFVTSDLPAVEPQQATISSAMLPFQVCPVELAAFRFDAQMKGKSSLQVVFMLITGCIMHCNAANS